MVNNRVRRGFTLIELLVVMAIIATLLALTMPRYFHSVDKSKEAALKSDLGTMREAIDKYYGDTGKYPDALANLVTRRYLREIPADPISGSNESWIVIAPKDAKLGNVSDVRAGDAGNALDGTPYAEW